MYGETDLSRTSRHVLHTYCKRSRSGHYKFSEVLYMHLLALVTEAMLKDYLRACSLFAIVSSIVSALRTLPFFIRYGNYMELSFSLYIGLRLRLIPQFPLFTNVSFGV